MDINTHIFCEGTFCKRNFCENNIVIDKAIDKINNKAVGESSNTPDTMHLCKTP